MTTDAAKAITEPNAHDAICAVGIWIEARADSGRRIIRICVSVERICFTFQWRRLMISETLEIAAQAVRMYAESHPRPTQVTQQQAAEMLSISRHTVSRLIKAGHLKLNQCGMISVADVDRMLLADSPKITHQRL
jgi:DNA-binding transcriptional regulator LsrR (DeoR family)